MWRLREQQRPYHQVEWISWASPGDRRVHLPPGEVHTFAEVCRLHRRSAIHRRTVSKCPQRETLSHPRHPLGTSDFCSAAGVRQVCRQLPENRPVGKLPHLIADGANRVSVGHVLTYCSRLSRSVLILHLSVHCSRAVVSYQQVELTTVNVVAVNKHGSQLWTTTHFRVSPVVYAPHKWSQNVLRSRLSLEQVFRKFLFTDVIKKLRTANAQGDTDVFHRRLWRIPAAIGASRKSKPVNALPSNLVRQGPT